jgi:hypothetical protein
MTQSFCASRITVNSARRLRFLKASGRCSRCPVKLFRNEPSVDQLDLEEKRRSDMPEPRDPSEQPPMPSPAWAPEPPIMEPEPDRLPDEDPVPNPDETREPPQQV